MAVTELFLTLMLALPFVGALMVILVRYIFPGKEALVAGSISVFCFIYNLFLYPIVKTGGSVYISFPWISDYGLNFSLRMDGLSFVFALLVTGIGLLVILYARYYIDPHDSAARFFALLMGFMGSVLGIVMSGNLIIFFVFWEFSSLFSFLLIGFWSTNVKAREAARLTYIISFFGGIALFIAILIIGHIVNSYEWDMVINAKEQILRHKSATWILVFLFMAAFTKSAQFPFHFWLPEAMSAPTPVSAYLHSATIVKLGVFLLARFWPIFSDSDIWFWVLGIVGLTSLLLGSLLAMFQRDIKAILAYSTISHVGLIVTLLSLGSPLACIAAVFHILNHATFKSSLFMAAGIIEHETGTRDMRQLSGLYRAMPITGTLAIVACAAMAGVPLLNGFLSKEMFFNEAALTHRISWLDTITPYIATIAGSFSVVYSIRFVHGIFFGPVPQNLSKQPHEPAAFMRLPIEFLVFLCLIVGIAPNLTIKPFLETAVIAILHSSLPSYNLDIWHGFNISLWMSIIALLAGLIIYIWQRSFLKYRNFNESTIKGRIIVRKMLSYLENKISPYLKDILSTNRLQLQLRIIFLAAIFGFYLIIIYLRKEATQLVYLERDFFVLDQQEIILASLWLIGIFCALGAAYQAKYHRLSAIMLLGGAGIVNCITFLIFSAPDVALTQFLVEVVSTILLLLGLRWLPKRIEKIKPEKVSWRSYLRRSVDFMLATISGAFVAILAYYIMLVPHDNIIAQYYLEKAYTLLKGENIVNVMLVDFRAFDSLAEITVLAIVALTTYSLLRRFRPANDALEPLAEQRKYSVLDQYNLTPLFSSKASDQFVILSVISRWLFMIISAVSLFLFLRGHERPGGGFAAAITLTTAFMLQYLILGTRWVESHLHILPLRSMAIGLSLTFIVGLLSIIFSYPYLTSMMIEFNLPILGKIGFSSVMLFDAGIFFVVVGATILILIALAHQSLRGYRVDKSYSESILPYESQNEVEDNDKIREL